MPLKNKSFLITLFFLGIVGLYLGVVSMYLWLLILFALLFTCNKTEIGLFLVFIGTSLFGRIFATEIVVITITTISTLLGIFILRNEYLKVIILNRKPLLLFIFFMLYFLVLFLLGPQNDYAKSKILKLLVRGIIWYISFLVFVQEVNIRYTKLTILYMVVALFYLSQSYEIYNIKPSGLSDISFFRTIAGTLDDTEWGASACNTHTLGYLALGAMTFRLMDSKCVLVGERYFTIAICILSFIIILLSGARQTFIGYALVLPLGLIMHKNQIFSIRSLFIVLLVFVSVIFIGFLSGSKDLNRIFITDESITYRLNRDVDTPLKIARDTGLFGLGFGGYISAAGNKNYPHNILLEIICEYGLIGFIVILIMMFIFINQYCISIFKYRTIRGSPMILLFLVFFLSSLISGDIAGNIKVFIMLFCCVKPFPLFIYTVENGFISIKSGYWLDLIKYKTISKNK